MYPSWWVAGSTDSVDNQLFTPIDTKTKHNFKRRKVEIAPGFRFNLKPSQASKPLDLRR